MTWVVLLASAVLAAVAAAGVLRPFVGPAPPRVDPVEDPIEVPQGGPDRRGTMVVILVAAALVAGTVPLLAGAVADRAPGGSITGGTSTNSAGGPLSFFERRVSENPGDLAARLDLAQRYLEAGEVRRATDQYLAALELDPANAEARAGLGYVLYLSGKPEEGLHWVEEALEVVPDYPEALYFKGVILLRGLNLPAEAAEALRAYLEAAPFGGHRSEVEQLLAEADGG